MVPVVVGAAVVVVAGVDRSIWVVPGLLLAVVGELPESAQPVRTQMATASWERGRRCTSENSINRRSEVGLAEPLGLKKPARGS